MNFFDTFVKNMKLMHDSVTKSKNQRKNRFRNRIKSTRKQKLLKVLKEQVPEHIKSKTRTSDFSNYFVTILRAMLSNF